MSAISLAEPFYAEIELNIVKEMPDGTSSIIREMRKVEVVGINEYGQFVCIDADPGWTTTHEVNAVRRFEIR